jgi:phytoene synthase
MSAPAPGEAGRARDLAVHCETLARQYARDEWLAALFAPEAARPGLHALSAFEYELRGIAARARDPHAAALRLAWWRESMLGERDEEAWGSPVASAIIAAAKTYALPRASLEDMTDAALEAAAGEDIADMAAFGAYAARSESARLRLAARIAAQGRDDETASAEEPAGIALSIVRTLLDLPRAGEAATLLIPRDMLANRQAKPDDVRARRATPGVIAALGDLRGLARDALVDAEKRLTGASPAVLPAFAPLGPLRLDLARLKRGAANPFAPPRQVAPWRRQWAIWRWARRR